VYAHVVEGDGAAGGAQLLGAGQHAGHVVGESPFGDLHDYLDVCGAGGEGVEDDVEALRQGGGLEVDEQGHRPALRQGGRVGQRRPQRAPFQVGEPAGRAGGVQQRHR
jgi:hypothetical protein